MNKYTTMKSRHEKEFTAFPMYFAFNQEQFKEAMAKMGLKTTDTNKVYSSGAGGLYLKTDSKKLRDMLNSHKSDMDNAIKGDTTGEGFIFDMFDYELANHEYCYTYDTEDTLTALGLSQEEIIKSKPLSHGLKLAKMAQQEADC